MKPTPIDDCLPKPWRKHLEKAKERIEAGTADLTSPELGEVIDEQGRQIWDENKVKEHIEAGENQKALDFHHNDPHIRLDDCGFPKNRAARNFSLTHNFRGQFTGNHREFPAKWLLLGGNHGTGKTSLAVRLMWEQMRKRPSLRPSYVSVGAWINSNMPEEVKQPIELIRSFVILDDIDKFDMRSEFQTRHLLRLIEHLIADDRKVIITANFTLDQLLAKKSHYNFKLVLDRLRGKVHELIFSGQSKRGR